MGQERQNEGQTGGGHNNGKGWGKAVNSQSPRSSGGPKGSRGRGGDAPHSELDFMQALVSGLEQDSMQALHRFSEKRNEKFDIIFGILSELQGRQGQLEESVRVLKEQCGARPQMMPMNTRMVAVPMAGPQNFGQQVGQQWVNGNMGECMNGQQTGSSFAGAINFGSAQPMQFQPMVPQAVEGDTMATNSGAEANSWNKNPTMAADGS
eukprot:gnl/TRDRNA2_/TRDRNA2_179858_c0_seq1.p1 gnl/TRDRNA2_/TRDRNA2_179858_c0~~gnl/TRDRNA2_/TRDRNA2_179858_c0_seq1.p1  ORF type:complete len:208 (+),score=47.30 gnl/TRDRNA2_/TRDRNA2_179858_c0_seq1:86-709(+)